MNEADDSILEYMSQLVINGQDRVAQSPTAVWVNLVQEMDILDRSTNTIGRRMGRLEEMGLLEATDDKRTYYKITDKGIAYVNGDITRDELPDPT